MLNDQGDVIAIIASDGQVMAEYSYNAWGKVLSATGTLAGDNPLRYRGYVYDTDLCMYYLNSRYYDPEICRFINADSFASTGQGFAGMNMFAYCLNNPVCYTDENGTDAESALAFWTTSASVLIVADGPLPIGDIIYAAGIIVCGIITFAEAESNSSASDKSPDIDEDLPNIEYPGDDPTVAPEGFEWRGKGKQGSKEGSYYNPKTGGSLHPDLDHPAPIGPHWDYKKSGVMLSTEYIKTELCESIQNRKVGNCHMEKKENACYRSINNPELFEFHDSIFNLDFIDKKNIAVYVRRLNISKKAEQNPKNYDLEIKRAHILFQEVSELTYDLGRTWKTDQHGKSVPVGPENLYHGKAAIDRMKDLLSDGAEIFSHDIFDGDYYEIHGWGSEPFFLARFKARNFIVDWDEYLKPAWYELRKEYKKSTMLKTPNGEVTTDIYFVYEYDADELFRADNVHDVAPQKNSIGIKYENEYYWGYENNASEKDAIANLQKQLPPGVLLKNIF